METVKIDREVPAGSAPKTASTSVPLAGRGGRGGLMMGEIDSSAKKRRWIIAVLAVVVFAGFGSLVVWKRFEITARYMQGSKDAQEQAILLMLTEAKPDIQKNLKMNFLEKVFSNIAGRRDESQRQADALTDVREYAEWSFKNHWLNYKDVHKVSSIDGYELHGYDFALCWNQGKTEEVVSAFNVNFLTRAVANKKVNFNCGYFAGLRLYIEKKARVN